jgi:hypothetical protein
MMTVADARRFAASRGAKWSGVAAPLWHIWLPRLQHIMFCRCGDITNITDIKFAPAAIWQGIIVFLILHFSFVQRACMFECAR